MLLSARKTAGKTTNTRDPARALWLSIACAVAAGPAAAQTPEWAVQREHGGEGLALDDAGNVYAFGGRFLLSLTKLDPSGTELWATPIPEPPPNRDIEWTDVAVDGDGNAYVAWRVSSITDIFLARYDTSGDLLWSRQFNTTEPEWSRGIAVGPDGNAYLCGAVLPSVGDVEALLVKYDMSGNEIWRRQLGDGVLDVSARDVDVDGAGNVYIAGTWGTPEPGTDAFLAKYDASGNLQWRRQFDLTGFDAGYAVAADFAGNVYLGGDYRVAQDDYDAFLTKYDPSGQVLWTRQFGSLASDGPRGVSVDGAGNAYVAGLWWTQTVADIYVAKYDPSGQRAWFRTIGTPALDLCDSLAVDEAGNQFVSGTTEGSFGTGNGDFFVAKFTADCYADCDQTPGLGVLDMFDFLCFQDLFLAEAPYACDCDTASGPGVCDIFDFLCFQDAFVTGCP